MFFVCVSSLFDDINIDYLKYKILIIDIEDLTFKHTLFVNYLKKVWGIKAYCMDTKQKMKNGQDRYRICIQDQESLLKLLPINY